MIESISGRLQQNFVVIAALALMALSQIYIVPKFLDTSDGLDFRLIWLAGKLWLSGENPYGDAFTKAYLATFGPGPVSHFWVYPPYWYAISVPFALLAFKTALGIWNGINLLSLWGGALCLASSVDGVRVHQTIIKFCLVSALVAFIQATPFALSIGQTSLLMFFGVSLFVYGFLRRQLLALAIALTLLMLKPSIGLAFVAVCLAQMWTWPAFIAPAVALTLSLIGSFVSGGMLASLAGFFANMAAYNSAEAYAGLPSNLVGLMQLFSIAGIDVPPLIALVPGYVLTFAVALSRAAPTTIMLVTVANMLFFVPLHVYDLTLIAAAAILCLPGPLMVRALVGVAVALVFRAGNMAKITGITNPEGPVFPGSLIASVGLAVLLLAAVLLFLNDRNRRAASLT